MASFDPYRKWLGIPEQFRPPTHYQLLGILPEEQDREAIETAVIRQSVYIRNFQKGPNSDVATQLLNEIAAAKNCLIDPVKRAMYDASLPANKAPAVPQAVAVPQAPVSASRPKRRAPARALRAEEMGIQAAPIDPLANLLAATAVDISQRAAPPPRRKLSDPLMLGGATIVLLVGGSLGVMILTAGPSAPPSEPLAAAAPVARTGAETHPNAPARFPATRDAELAKPSPTAKAPIEARPSGAPTSSATEPSSQAAMPAPDGERADEPPAQPPALAASAAVPSDEPTAVCMNVLATDAHYSRSDAGGDKNVYALTTDEPIDPRTTEIQFRMNATDNASAGEVTVETGGGTWRKVGEWTPRSMESRAPDGGWQRLRLDKLQRKTPLRQIKVRLASPKGSKPADISEVKWGLSSKSRGLEQAGAEDEADPTESAPGESLSDLLATDKHTGQTGGNSFGNIYTLTADESVDLRSTVLRYRIGVYNPSTIGEISLQLDDGKWRQVGRWTPRTVKAALAKDGWTQLRLNGLPDPMPAREFKVRFQYTGGGNVLDFHECQWWRSGREPSPTTNETTPSATLAPATTPALEPLGGEYTADSMHCLAFDDHFGAAGGKHERNVYTLAVDEPIELRSTEIRYQARAGKNSSSGEILIDTGSGAWKKIDQWSPQSLAAHADQGGWDHLRLDSAPRKGLVREVKIRFEYKGGGSSLEIYHVQWCLPPKERGRRAEKAPAPQRSDVTPDSSRPRMLATDEHQGLTGAQHTANVYSLTLPEPVDLRSTFLRFRIEADGDLSFGDIAIDTGDGKWRQVGGWTERMVEASRTSGGWSRLRLDGLPAAPPASEIKVRLTYRGGGHLLRILEVQCWSAAENAEN